LNLATYFLVPGAGPFNTSFNVSVIGSILHMGKLRLREVKGYRVTLDTNPRSGAQGPQAPMFASLNPSPCLPQDTAGQWVEPWPALALLQVSGGGSLASPMGEVSFSPPFPHLPTPSYQPSPLAHPPSLPASCRTWPRAQSVQTWEQILALPHAGWDIWSTVISLLGASLLTSVNWG
jgi:hypothetical protein